MCCKITDVERYLVNAFLEILRNISKIFFIASLAVLAGGIIFICLPKDLATELIDEDGPVEVLQVIVYIISAIICIIYKIRKIWSGGLSAGFLLTMLALRELDFQVKFTEISMTRTKFYFSPDMSLTAKIMGGIVVISILFVLITFAWRYFSGLINGIRNHKIWSILTMNGLIFIPLAMVIDKFLTLLDLIGFEDTIKMELTKTFFEELAELAIPVLFFGALITYGISFYKNQALPRQGRGWGGC